MNDLTIDREFLPEIHMVSRPEISMHTLLNNTEPGLLKLSDQSPLQLTDTAKFLLCIEQLVASCGSDSIPTILRNLSRPTLESIAYSFVVIADMEATMSFRQDSRVTTNICQTRMQNVSATLGTGPLFQWFETIVSGAQLHQSFCYLIIANKLQLHLERFEGLSLVFDRFRKTRLKDQSYILELK